MKRKNYTIPILAFILAILVIGLFRFKPWQHKAPLINAQGAPIKVLTVGFLPVTCHLTCPVTAFASKTSSTMRFDSRLYHDWPTVAEAFKSGRLNATFMLAPMAMQMAAEGVGCKIVYLGHRDGSTMVIAKNSTAKSLKDLEGKEIAIPSFESNQYLVLLHAMRMQGVPQNSIKFVQLAPPDMPAALAAHAIAGYFVGEPFAGAAQLSGVGKVLYYSYQLWPNFISCVLVVSDALIKDHPNQIRDLVRGIAESGKWADTHRLQAARIGAHYFHQKVKLLDFVLTDPPGRVKYEDLTPSDTDMLDIEHDAYQAGILKTMIPLSQYLDRQFIPKTIPNVKINALSCPP